MDPKELAAAIARLEAQRDAATGDERKEIEAQIGLKSATLTQLLAGQETLVEGERNELEALRKEKAERELQATIDAGVKEHTDGEEDRIAAVLERVLESRGLNGTGATPTRTFVHPTAGGKGGPAVVTTDAGDKEPHDFVHFLKALANRDRSEIGRIQVLNGMKTGAGGKALVEGNGAVDAVAGPSGGYIVPPIFSKEIIGYLYANTVLRRAGVTVLPMGARDIYQPRVSGTARAYYRGETAPITVSQQTFDQFHLSAKTLAALVPMSWELVNDADPAVETLVREDLGRQLALTEDYQFLVGAGSTTAPQGLLTRSDVQVIAAGTNGTAVTYNYLIDMQTRLKKANVRNVKRIWVSSPDLEGTIRKIVDSQGRPIFADYLNPQDSTLSGAEGTLFGRPFYTTTQIPLATTGTGNTTYLAYMELSEIFVGQRGEVEIAVADQASYVDAGGSQVNAFQAAEVLFRAVVRHDIQPHHPAAVVVGRDVLY